MYEILIERDVPMLTRDGIILNNDIYRPREPGRHPALLSRTPYGSDLVGAAPFWDAALYAQAGYVAILQDCRGCGNSEGRFVYYHQLIQERLDGYDAVEWAAGLPFSDGNVGMFGGSYLGYTQWAAAMERPPHLRAIAPMLIPARCYDGLIYRGGAFELGMMLTWHLQMSPNAVRWELTDGGFNDDKIKAVMEEIGAANGRLSPGGYLDGPLYDLPWLRHLNLGEIIRYLLAYKPGCLPDEWSIDQTQVQAPALNIGGWYDVFPQGTLDNYTGMRQRSQGAGRQSQVVLGPWSHLNYGSLIGQTDFGAEANSAALPDNDSLLALHLRWYDHWLRGVDNGIDRTLPVRVFVTGENRWRSLPDWPPIPVHQQAYYLQPEGGLSLGIPASGDETSHYTYDPTDPTPTLGGGTLMVWPSPAGVVDQRPLSQREDVLTLTSSLLEQSLTVLGKVDARLWISSSAPDTDFVVRLLDIHPDGYQANLCDGILRARYRDSLVELAWLEPGQVYELRIDLWSSAHTFLAGHRIGVQISSASFPRWDRNWNTREDPASATVGQPARQTIWHDAKHPSAIVMQVEDTSSNE